MIRAFRSTVSKAYGYRCLSQQHIQRNEENVIVNTKKIEPPHDANDLYSFITSRMRMHAEKTAIVDATTGKSNTYSEVLQNSSKLASFLKSKGLSTNDTVAIHTPNGVEYLYAIMSSFENRHVLTTANPAYTPFEINRQLLDSNAQLLYTNNELVDVARRSAENSGVQTIISLDDSEVNDRGVVNLSTILGSCQPATPQKRDIYTEDEVSLLLYSSGTTGLPKGVMLSHSNVSLNILQTMDAFEYKIEDSLLSVLPMFHCFGLVVSALKTLWYGGTVYTVPQFEPTVFLESIEKYKIERLHIAPPLAVFLKNHPMVQNYDLSSVGTIICGAAPMDEMLVNALYEKLPNMKLQQGFGMTELSPVACIQQNKKEEHRFGSSGVVIPSTKMKIVDIESGKNLGPNETGEVQVAGPQVMKGYLNNLQATEATINDDGWLMTGDLGYYDENNNIFVVDRLKELIKYKGYQVAPAELEAILLSHPQITDACVIGVPDERSGEIPRGYIVTNGDVTESHVHDFLAEKVSDHKKLRGGIEFREILPKSPSGKLLRRFLKDELLASNEN